MTDQQLNLFTASGREPLAAPAVTPAAEDTATCPTEPASRPEHPDDGSLHWMLTGKPEPVPARTGACRNCGQLVIWARTEKKRWMPLDPQPVPDAAGTTHPLFVLRDTGSSAGPTAIAAWGLEGTEPHYRSHFDTCTERKAA